MGLYVLGCATKNFHFLPYSKWLTQHQWRVPIEGSFFVFEVKSTYQDSLIWSLGSGGQRKTDMVVIPLTSCVVNGRTKWTLMSERKTGNNGESKIGYNRENKTVNNGEKKYGNNRKKSHKCNNCSFSTFFGANLRLHMRRHNSEKLFKCDQCSYGGNQKVTSTISQSSAL